MKKYKKFLLVATSLTVGSMLTVLSGCAAPIKLSMATNANWQLDTTVGIIQNDAASLVEECDYAVSVTTPTNNVYSYTLTDASYKTKLSVANYTWSATESERVYCYETTLTRSGYYTYLNGGANEKVTFENDVTKTVSYFRSAANNLQPVYSKTEIRSSSPVTMTPTSAKNMMQLVNYETEVTYNKECTSANVKNTNLANNESKETEIDLSKTQYSVFDTAYSLMAMRSIPMTKASSAVCDLLVGLEGRMANFTVQSGAAQELGEGNETIASAIASSFNVTAEKYYYVPVTLTLNSDMPGTTKVAWFTAMNNYGSPFTAEKNNVCKSTMIKYVEALPYGLGQLNVTLKSANWTQR